jgi:hypothetical protein
MKFYSRRVKYPELVSHCNNSPTVSDSGVPHIAVCRPANKNCLYLPAWWAGTSSEIARHTPSEWRWCSRDSMRRFCGLFTGTKLFIHTQWPATARMFSWASQRSIFPENIGKSAPAPLEDDAPAAMFFIFVHVLKGVWWSRGSVLAFGTQVGGFKPGRSRRILRAKKSSAHLPSEGK